jgi:glucose/mannose-6-phosphate isomerase
MMIEDLSIWGQKLKDGKALAKNFWSSSSGRLPKNIKKIAFIGMGGSGIAGRIVKTFLDKKEGLFSFIVDSPEIPAYIDSQTLSIVISYSGNTWETVCALNQLADRFIPTIVIANGGKAIEIAETKNLPFTIAPKSISPRAALGYFLGFLFELFDSIGIMDGKKTIDLMCEHAETYIPKFSDQSYFKEFLEKAKDKSFFHIWGISGDSAACAYRAQTQFNENSKVCAVSSVFPELCHNLMVGFTNLESPQLVTLLHTDFITNNTNIAIESTCDILNKVGVDVYRPPVLGNTLEQQLYNIILWSDFASYYLGQVRNVDVCAVKIIDDLKEKHKQKGLKLS